MKTAALGCLSIFSVACLLAQVAPRAEANSEAPLTRFEESLENEAELIARIRAGILGLQGAAAPAPGVFLRGTHAKGFCVEADFLVRDLTSASDLSPGDRARLTRGIFARPGIYSAWARFANGKGSVNPDATPDVRSLSFAVDLPAGALGAGTPARRQDFSMNNAPTFPINDARDFEIVLRAATSPEGPRALDPVRELPILLATLAKGQAQENQEIAPLQLFRYWSGTPFLLGEDQAIKYSAVPCASNRAEALDLSDANFLRTELARQLRVEASGAAPQTCFEFRVQFLNAERFRAHLNLTRESEQYWVENASANWDETEETPYLTVGYLRLKAGELMDQAACERLRINVNRNTLPEQRGIGSINRARTEAENASAERRGARP